jgi:hypothetical protein
MGYKRQYDYIYQNMGVIKPPVDYFAKWSPVIIKNLDIDIKIVNIVLSEFFEIYSMLEDNFRNVMQHNPLSRSNPSNIPSNIPEDFIKLEQTVLLFKKDIQNFILNDADIKLNIVSEYYNVLTKKKGLLLENGVRIEDGKFLDSKHQEKVDNKLRSVLNDRIEYILEPSKRKTFYRKQKLERIIKD